MRNVFPYISLDPQRTNDRSGIPATPPAAQRSRGKGPVPPRHLQGRQGKGSAAFQYRRH
ncbi:hypothetical protein [Motilibacter aurantiacus]|uniref:hypothetical protein n=1 Tax=Motilibacter aurantiacus TaxID=2714955 RepID=UPI001407F645|nr:hypothetical protein [Motilibacter aurantiacus]NHC45667.1 hypothetical protein [Motilibacter aurantiacus]